MKAERINILLIEDNPLDARFITELLKEVRFFHHHLSVAETVRGGLEHLQKNETDIILLDLNLPDSMGQQTFETIYNQHKEIPIILVSGLEDEDLSIDLIQLGAQDYIAKANVDVHALEKSIGYSLERNKINNRIKEELNNRLKAEEQLKFFAAILGHLNRQNEWQKLIRDILNEIKSFTGFDAVEIRLRHGEDYPYFVQSGFAEAFIKEENFLCAKSTDCSVRKDRYGLSVLECTCGVVLSGKTDASKPFFTKGGSFWTNHSVDLLYLSPIEDPRTNPRNNCIHSGYMSVALVPIHSGDEIIGLLQLNDRQPGRFTPDLIQFFEKIGSAIGVAFKRMQYEEKIKESEDKYRRIVETANEGILWVDEKRVITFSNSKMMQILGCQINELIGRKFESLLFPEDIADHSRKLEARRKGKPEIYELRFRHHDGRIVWTLVSAVPILDAQGEFKGSFAMFTDITGRKQAEEILIEKEERYQSLIQTSLDGFWVADSEGRLLEVNDAYCLMTGYSREKLLTMRISDLECAESQEKTHEHIQKIISTGHDRFESKHRCADGEIINVQINTIYINSKSIFLVFINDITKRKLAEKELIEAKEKAEESDRLKSAFLATMSHELRTPLNAVIGFSGLIDEEMPMDQITSFAQVIHKSGNNLLEIVEGIFDLTMLESKEVKVKAGHFNLSSFIIDLLELAKYEQKKSGKQQVDIKYISGSGNGHADLYSDKGKLTKVMIQLLKNALKFTPSGKIEFGYVLEPEGKYDQIKFFVKDTGIGIPENQKSIIFERFRQIDDSLARNFGGTGIGLSISKQTVELLGGQIGVDSEPGKGSTFYFTIPILKQEQLPNTVRVSKQEDNGGKRETFSNQTVLIAEDEDSNYMYLRILLLRLNLQVLHAHDGLEAVNLCSVHPEISLVLMDINMPNMNGLEATKEIKLTNAKLPVIAVTAFTMPGDREKFLDGGCDEYLEKPIKRDKLLTLLRSFIN